LAAACLGTETTSDDLTMSGNRDDAGTADAERLDDQTVVEYLRTNPDFLARFPDALDGQQAPDRWDGDGVVDIHQFMLDRLRREMDELRTCAADLIETSRSNMSNQTRTHAAVLAMMATIDFAHTVRLVRDDLPLLLNVDVVSICFEPAERPVPGLGLPDIQTLSVGTVDGLIGNGQDVALQQAMSDDGSIFAAAAGIVRSAALARLRPSGDVPTGMLALGTRRPAAFYPGQGTELVSFLALVVERSVHRWLDPPE
jgi:uncharacterized protein YigA (DUF484 family)